ncbi:hypothetical protein HT031_004546 [Scenedesmus sp. PABB004]|nr:hypothetical protein HT031_004546 [Scenedesmus sp. PABB004]
MNAARLALCLVAALALAAHAGAHGDKGHGSGCSKHGGGCPPAPDVCIIKPRPMTPDECKQAYSHSYVPHGKGADHGVPKRLLKRVNYKGWAPGMACTDASAHTGHCLKPCPNPPPYFPIAWDWISNNPNMTLLTAAIRAAGMVDLFNTTFTGTLLAPNDEAMARYLKDVTVDLFDPAFAEFTSAFLRKLISYHVLPVRAYARDFAGAVGTKLLPSIYFSINSPHMVNITTIDLSPNCTNCTTLYTFITDQQSRTAQFVEVDKLVYCGGVIHTINAVLQPNDVYPSVSAAVAGAGLTSLGQVLVALNTTNPGFIAVLEELAGTLAAPNNEAFSQNVDPAQLESIVRYHVCPTAEYKNLLYFPFNSGKNPCWTSLGIQLKDPLLKLTYLVGSYAIGEYPNMSIRFPTLSGGLGNSKIVMGDITTPRKVMHISAARVGGRPDAYDYETSGCVAAASARRLEQAEPAAAQVSAFTAAYGPPRLMTPAEVEEAFGEGSEHYVPSGKGPHHKVPPPLLDAANVTCRAPYFPTAWDWISNNPNLTLFSTAVRIAGMVDLFNGSFVSTLLAPTNEAVLEYIGQTAIDILAEEYEAFVSRFLARLLKYHVVLLRCAGRRLFGVARGGAPRRADAPAGRARGVPPPPPRAAAAPGRRVRRGCRRRGRRCSVFACEFVIGTANYTTAYRSINGPHMVEFVTIDLNPGCPNCTTLYNYLRDEQGDVAQFETVDKFVYGGGIIHTINAVLGANDIFPSLAAMISKMNLTSLADVLAVMESREPGYIQSIEESRETLAAPNNAAFAAAPPVQPDQLNAILRYHQCPVQFPGQLLRDNPCATKLARSAGNPALALDYKIEIYGFGTMPKMWIAYPSTPAPTTSRIVFADITTPIQVSHIVNKVLVPPV